MKKHFLVIIGVILSNLLYSQFEILLNDVYSTDSMSAWVVGDNGTIIHIVEGGMYWEDHSYNTDLMLNSIQFVNELKGFIVGESGLVLRTTDGGNLWEIIDLGVTYNFKSVLFVDDQYGWISSYQFQGEGLFKTINGGKDWEYINVNNYHHFFIDSINGWSCRYSQGINYINRTHDGGLLWNAISSVSWGGLPSIFFLDSLYGIRCSPWIGNTSCYNTINGGLSWSPNNLSLTPGDIYDIYFLDTLNGWISVYNGILYSNDFFASFEGFGYEYERFISLSIHGYSNGWAVSNYLDCPLSKIWKLNGINEWIQIELVGIQNTSPIQLLSINPNPAHSEVIISGIDANAIEEVSIYNTTGQRVLHQKGADRKVDISDLQQGLYVVEVVVGNARIRGKLIVR